MLRKTMISALFLIASGSAMAGDDGRVYGRAVSVEPSFSLSFSSGHPYHYREPHYSGHRYGYDHYRPYETVYVPRPVVKHVYHNNYYRVEDGRHHKHHRGWKERHERREWRDDHGRGHGRGHDWD